MIIPSFLLTPLLWFGHLIIVHVISSHRYARKRALRHELDGGPFPVTGQEIRKATSAHARHQIHSYFGAGRINYEKDLSGGTCRGFAYDVPTSHHSCITYFLFDRVIVFAGCRWSWYKCLYC